MDPMVPPMFMLNLQEEAKYYREKYQKIIILSNNLIDEIPRSLKDAEAMMNIFKPQKEICDFLMMCRFMVEEFRTRIKGRC